MPLTEFCYIPSVATDAFYMPEERAIHERMIKLYSLRKREKEGQGRAWRISSINRVLKKHKEQLSAMLKKSLEDNITRELNPEAVKDKNIINLFCSELIRNLGIQSYERSDKIIIVNVFTCYRDQKL